MCTSVKERSKLSMKFFQAISQTPRIDKYIFVKDTVLLGITTVALIYFLGFGCDAFSRVALN